MSRDLVVSNPIQSLNGAVGEVDTIYGYTESIGLFGKFRLQTYNMQTETWSTGTTSYYGIAQMDGLAVHRVGIGNKTGDIPLIDQEGRYGYANGTPYYVDPLDTDAGWVIPAVYEFDILTGNPKYRDGAPVLISESFHLILRNSSAILQIIGVSDRYVFVQCNVVVGGSNVTRIYAHAHDATEVFDTPVKWQTVGRGLGTMSAAPGDNLFLIFPSTVNSASSAASGRDFDIILLYTFNYDGSAWSSSLYTDTSLRNYDDTLPSSTGRTNIALKAFYSKHLDAFIGVYKDEVKVFSRELRPDTVLAPYAPIEYTDPEDPPPWEYTGEHIYDDTTPEDWLDVVSISATNPAVVTVSGSLSAWMLAQGISDGDYVYFSGMAPFSGMKDRNDSNLSFCHFAAPKVSESNHRITVIDDSSFSIPIDGAAAMDVNYLFSFDDLTGSGTDRECRISPYTKCSADVGDQVIFGGFTPSSHPINGYITTIVADNFSVDFNVILPLGTWGTTPHLYSEEHNIGWVKPYQASGVYPVVPDNYADETITPHISPSPCSVAIASIDYDVDPPILTADREFWFDECSVEDIGETIKAHQTDYGTDFNYALYGQLTLTKVDVDSFTVQPRENFIYSVFLRSGGMPSTYHPTIYLWERWVPVGSKVRLKGIKGFPTLENVITTILSRDGQGHYVLDIDTTGLGPYNPSASGSNTVGILQTSLRGGVHVGRPDDLDVDPPPESTPPPAPVPIPKRAGVGFEVYTYVKGDRGEPAVGAIVTWSDTAGSTFDPPKSVCDAEGKATTICIVPVAWMGGLAAKNNTITASTEW